MYNIEWAFEKIRVVISQGIFKKGIKFETEIILSEND